MVDHCDSGCCATWFAGWEKTLELAETIPTAQEMPISHRASFISALPHGMSFYWDSPADSERSRNPRAFLAFPQDPREGVAGCRHVGQPERRPNIGRCRLCGISNRSPG